MELRAIGVAAGLVGHIRILQYRITERRSKEGQTFHTLVEGAPAALQKQWVSYTTLLNHGQWWIWQTARVTYIELGRLLVRLITCCYRGDPLGMFFVQNILSLCVCVCAYSSFSQNTIPPRHLLAILNYHHITPRPCGYFVSRYTHIITPVACHYIISKIVSPLYVYLPFEILISFCHKLLVFSCLFVYQNFTFILIAIISCWSSKISIYL